MWLSTDSSPKTNARTYIYNLKSKERKLVKEQIIPSGHSPENYITEKIWDSIENYCLPIYYAGKDNSIYKIFPKNSFVDYAEFNTPEELFHYLKKISDIEYKSRLEKCIFVYNSFIEKPKSFWKETKNMIIDKCKEITFN